MFVIVLYLCIDVLVLVFSQSNHSYLLWGVPQFCISMYFSFAYIHCIMNTFIMKIIKLWFTWPKPVFCFYSVIPHKQLVSSLGSELANILNASLGLVGIPIHTHLKNQDIEQKITIQEGGGDKKVNVLN